MISSGTASSAPVVPHTQAQKLSASRIISGLMVSLRPTSVGVTMFASIRWSDDEDDRRQHRPPRLVETPSARRRASSSAATIGPR